MDFDGDGILDVLSGSWPGEIYFFRGEGKGKFAGGVTIKGTDGKPIRLGNASTVFAFDWNGDGRLDLLVGCIDGSVSLIPNQGSSKKPAFGRARKLTAAGQVIRVPDGDSGPVVADWDGDGKPDLVVGAGDGSVLWYRNAGSRTDPQFEAARVLIPATRRPGYAAALPTDERGMRAKVCVTDWNGDGTLDLLVGDFTVSQGKKPQLSPGEQAAEKGARAEVTAAIRDLQLWRAEMQRLGRPPAQPARRARWERARQVIRARHRSTMDRLQQAQRALMKYQPRFETDGFVWLVAGRPAAVAQRH